MLRLSAAQIARIDENELRAFIDHLAEGMRRIIPEETSHLGDDDLRDRVEIATRQALRSGLETQRDVMLYVMATLWLEPDFPERMPELYEILANPAVPYDERRHELVEAYADRAVERSAQ